MTLNGQSRSGRSRRITGNTGHLMREGGIPAKVTTRSGTMTALDLELRKDRADGGRLALVSYLHRPWVGWVREEGVTHDA